MLLCVALLSLNVFGGRLSQSERAVPACHPLMQLGELDDPADRLHAPPRATGQDERELPRLDDLFARPAVAPGAPADPGWRVRATPVALTLLFLSFSTVRRSTARCGIWWQMSQSQRAVPAASQ